METRDCPREMGQSYRLLIGLPFFSNKKWSLSEWSGVPEAYFLFLSMCPESLHFVIYRESAIRIVGAILLCVDTEKDAFFVRTNINPF